MVSSGWVAVRCIFRSWIGTSEGEVVYEERVTLWREAGMDRAIERAEVEAQTYATETTWPSGQVTEYLGLAQAFSLFDEPADGAEVFSLMRTSSLPATTYLDRFFDTGQERQGVVGEADGPA